MRNDLRFKKSIKIDKYVFDAHNFKPLFMLGGLILNTSLLLANSSEDSTTCGFAPQCRTDSI